MVPANVETSFLKVEKLLEAHTGSARPHTLASRTSHFSTVSGEAGRADLGPRWAFAAFLPDSAAAYPPRLCLSLTYPLTPQGDHQDRI
jgi:hypothetical protein